MPTSDGMPTPIVSAPRVAGTSKPAQAKAVTVTFDHWDDAWRATVVAGALASALRPAAGLRHSCRQHHWHSSPTLHVERSKALYSSGFSGRSHSPVSTASPPVPTLNWMRPKMRIILLALGDTAQVVDRAGLQCVSDHLPLHSIGPAHIALGG